MSVNAFRRGAESLVGDLLVRQGLLTEGQLGRARQEQAASANAVPLEAVVVQLGFLTPKQVASVRNAAGKRPRLGELLIRCGVIGKEQLDAALSEQATQKMPLGQLLVRLGYLTDERMRQAISAQLNIPYVDLDRITIDPALTRIINRNYARRHSVVPIAAVGQNVTVCMDDPTNQSAVDELRRSTGYTITVVTAAHEAIEQAFRRLYAEALQQDGEHSTEDDLLELITDEEGDVAKLRYGNEYKSADALVRRLLTTAIAQRCSDIHLEMLPDRLSVRFRTDGVLKPPPLGEMQPACNDNAREIVSRLKILAKLDIAERRRPQDGSFRVRASRGGERSTVDLRVSIVPSLYGESVVLRVLDKAHVPDSLEALGLPHAVTRELQRLLQRPSGILLVTGPTGSGKSTTLYTALQTLYRPEIRILTAEDPVEYVYEEFSQCQVNSRIGNTFAAYLRAFLRHDPEVILVGEIRDQETAEMAFRAAQTGHLLLSTIHTNTAVGAVTRLRDLGLDGSVLASSLNGVLGQRLVRQLCNACKTETSPSPELLREFFGELAARDIVFYAARGCGECKFTGYSGRAPIVELWIPSEHDMILIGRDASFDEIETSARRSTFSMADSAWELLSAGRTTLAELFRVVPYSTIHELRTRGARNPDGRPGRSVSAHDRLPRPDAQKHAAPVRPRDGERVHRDDLPDRDTERFTRVLVSQP